MQTNSSTVAKSSQSEGLREWYFVAAVLFVTVLTYISTLQYGFVYDDEAQIRTNPFVRSWQYVPQYFVSSVWKQLYPLAPGNYYRPMFLLWIRVNYATFGLRVMGWHLTGILLHVLVTWLVYSLIKKLTGRFTVAWFTALIFGVHPIHHEVVGWVSGTTESLFAAMFLAAFLAYLNSRESSKTIWMMASAVLYGIALLCKETAIILPLLVFANEWIIRSFQAPPNRPSLAARFGRALLPAAIYVPVAAAYLIERKRVLAGLGHALTNISISTWFLTLPSILVFYIKNWFFPIHLSEFYDVFFQSHVSFRGVILPALVLIVVAAALWMLRKHLGVRATGYAAIWILIPLLPALDTFVFRNGELVHDRYFYVPSIGASMLVALLIDWAFSGQPAVFGQPARVVGAALALAAVLGFCAGKQVSYWQDDYTLFSRGHEIAPLNGSALNNLAVELIIRKEGDSARALLESGIQEFPADERLLFNLGRLNYAEKDYSKSEDYAWQSLRLDPTSPDPYILIGQIRLKQGNMQEAIQAFRHGIELNPYDSTYHTSYGILLKLNGDCAGAKSQFDEALALNPSDAIARIQQAGCRASSPPITNSAMKSAQP